jgi:hypothetical protein
LEVKVNITDEDLWNFHKFIIFNSPKFKQRYYINMFFSPVIPFLILYIMTRKLLISLLLSLILGGSSYLINHFITKRRYIKLAKGREGVWGEHIYEITPEGIIETTKINRDFLKWEGVLDIKENSSYIFMVLSENVAHTLPKRFFKNEDEIKRFIVISRNYMDAVRTAR